ncbi:hypothetical protein C8R45DRAFT_1221255 [Mycena sanguinolenta]|nr:hypothetical protein C8R45DRAFT_1221255 [Mycena sanguinolenta]
MPRVERSPRRATRGTQRPVPQKLARTAASVRIEAMENAGSVSAPPIVKREPVPLTIPPPQSTSAKKAASVSSKHAWRHWDELQYIRSAGKTWNDIAIVRFVVANAFSIPARSTHSSDPWVNVRCSDRSDVILPRGYRFPLLWVAKYLWVSVKLVLTAEASIRQREWDAAKFEILHIARLCAGLLERARKQMDEGGVIERGWRCTQFDRVLHRYWHDWLISRDEFVRDFFREFGEDEYKGDVLKLTWSRWVLKSHKGFALTKEEADSGISAAEFMRGFVVREDGTFEWREDEDDPQPIQEDAADVQRSACSDKPGNPPTVPKVSSVRIHPPLRQARPEGNPYFRRPQSGNPYSNHPVYRHLFQSGPAGAGADAREATSTSGSTNMWMKMKGGRMAFTTGSAAAVERRIATMAERGADGEATQVDARQPGHELGTSRGAAALATSMASLRPGSKTVVLRDISGSVSEPEPAAARREQEEEESRMDDEKMPLHAPQKYQNPAPEIEGANLQLDVEEDEEEEDLELLYPESDQPSQTAPTGMPSATSSPSPSRSVSPVPPLSTARFPALPSGAPPAAHLMPQPPHGVSQLTAAHVKSASTSTSADTAAESGKFLQSCERLVADMHVLRAEVAQVRAGIRGVREGNADTHAQTHRQTHTSITELEARVRRLEEALPCASGKEDADADADGAGRRWFHPLQHLLRREGDTEMDVDDESEGPVSDGAGATSTLKKIR